MTEESPLPKKSTATVNGGSAFRRPPPTIHSVPSPPQTNSSSHLQIILLYESHFQDLEVSLPSLPRSHPRTSPTNQATHGANSAINQPPLQTPVDQSSSPLLPRTETNSVPKTRCPTREARALRLLSLIRDWIGSSASGTGLVLRLSSFTLLAGYLIGW